MADKLTILLWNLQKRSRLELLRKISVEQNIDILVLLESKDDPATIVEHLKSADDEFAFVESALKRIQVFSRRAALELQFIQANLATRISIYRFVLAGLDYHLVAVHGISKARYLTSDQNPEAMITAEELRVYERENGHRRTMMIGDFNLNPFEEGMISAAGFHAMMAKESTLELFRTIQKRKYPYFYNPMWSCFGDGSPGPPGTFFYRASGHHVSYDWNIYDQILLRPEILQRFDESVEIVNRIGDIELESPRHTPNTEVGSDHFPVKLVLASKVE